MKNLKKVLALVLVVATLMGFATIASAKFTDSSSIEQTEAVEVMTLINVINGYTDGSFRPDANVTRAQMAKMVAYIVAGGEDVGDLYAGANTFPDSRGHWAEGYIAYANKTGIITGTTTGLFNPDGSVTGTQAAKMMLCALGYDADIEKYVGSNWDVNVLSDAREAGLLKGLTGVAMNMPLSRENAAKLMFNALEADVVRYTDRGTEITLPDGSSFIMGASDPIVATDIDNVDYDSSNTTTLQLCEKYFPDLEKDTQTSADEAFNRPSHDWTYKKSSVGPYANEAEVVYTAKTDADDVEKDLKNCTLTATTTKGFGTAPVALANKAAIAAQTKNGTIVEVYVNSADQITDVIVIQPQAGTVTLTKVTATSSRGAYTQYTVGGVSGKIFSTVVDEDKDTDTVILNGDIANKDFVTYYQDKDNNLYLFPTTEIGGVLSAVKSNGQLTIDGTNYKVSSAATETTYTASKDEQTFAVDNYGYILKTIDSANETRYAMILDDASYIEIVDNKGTNVKAVLLATTDGKVVTAKVDDAETDVTPGLIVSYTVNSKGVYALTDISTAPAANVFAIDGIENGKSQMDKVGSGTAYASTATMFVFADFNSDGDPEGTVTTYTGYNNVPSYDGLAKTFAVDTNTNADGIMDVVFVYDDATAMADDEYVYVKGTYSTTVDGVAYDVIIKGEESTIVLDAPDASLVKDLYSKVTVTSGNVTTATPATGAYGAVKNNGGVLSAGASNSSLSAKGNVKDDAPVYYINLSDNTSGGVGTAADLSDTLTVDTANGEEIFVVMNSAGTEVTSIYILRK